MLSLQRSGLLLLVVCSSLLHVCVVSNAGEVPLVSWRDLWTSAEKSVPSHGGNEIVPASNLRDLDRRIWIITTASLPWMTGTSINPLLRAAYLAKDRPAGKVTLMVPYVPMSEQHLTFGEKGLRFPTIDSQREYIKNWLIEDAKMTNAAEKLDIVFYSATYHDEYHSIFPMGDITALIPDEEADVCVMEEPEHLNWYRAPFSEKTWMDKFKHVVGIIHTNYLVYTRGYKGGMYKEPFLKVLNQQMGRAYCHKIIKLSGALQEFAPEKEVVANVHGVRNKYLEIGDSQAARGFTKGAYFVGKLAWAKGFGEMFSLMRYLEQRTGRCFDIDIYGNGPHENEIKTTAMKQRIRGTFMGAKDHTLMTEYSTFVNPSVSEVLCTATVEALAMGKWVVCPKHPSNDFFEQFPNCLTYRNAEEFAANVYWALSHDPLPLTPSLRHELSWEAATERLMASAMVTHEMQERSRIFYDKFVAWAHEGISRGRHGDLIRSLAGGRSAAGQFEFAGEFGASADPQTVINKKQAGQGRKDLSLSRSLEDATAKGEY